MHTLLYCTFPKRIVRFFSSLNAFHFSGLFRYLEWHSNTEIDFCDTDLPSITYIKGSSHGPYEQGKYVLMLIWVPDLKN